MRKLVVLMLVICMVLCACSKEEQQTKIDTPQVTEALVVEEHCENCNKKTVLKEYKYNEKYMYLCDDCYAELETKVNDYDNYETLISAAYLACTYDDAMAETMELGVCEISIGPDGVSFENVGEKLKKHLLDCCPEMMELTTSNKYSFEISKLCVPIRTIAPEKP